MKKILITIAALLSATAGAAQPQLSQEQEDACGAILCLAGGGAPPECKPYLARFYDTDPSERGEFLQKCPSPGLSEGALGELAAHGVTCEPEKLAAFLNRQVCSQEQKERGFVCVGDRPSAWRMCANFYAELTDAPPPRLVQRCQDTRDGSGAIEQICSHWWVSAEYATGSWCEGKDASCQETDVRSAANGPIAKR
jgi:hypothetical protein